MKEKLLEDWLAKTTERTFQYTFAYLLQMQNYKILHITRHCGLEMGKDIIAIDPKGNPTAFQLKIAPKGKLKLKDWREMNSQVRDLVYLSITHPSLGNYSGRHFSYLATNGELEEEVIKAINDFNKTLKRDRKPILKTIVKGEILNWAKKLYPDFLFLELENLKPLLELLIESGKSYLPKEKLTSLIESITFLNQNKRYRKKEALRRIASAGLINSIAVSNFEKENNWIALIESWIIYLASVYAMAEKYALKTKEWENIVNICEEIIYLLLFNLYEEVKNSETFIYDIFDRFFYEIRLNYLVALMSVFGLWRKIKNEQEEEVDSFIKDFIERYRKKMKLYGESSIFQFLAFYWYYRTINASWETEKILIEIIKTIIMLNDIRNTKTEGLPPPYFSPIEILLHLLGIEKKDETFKGSSYFLKGLIYLIVKQNYKQTMKSLWPDITRIDFIEFIPKEKWHYYLFRNQEGTVYIEQPKKTEEWSRLKEAADNIDESRLPVLMRDKPILLLLFLLTYPHRVNAEVIKFLDKVFTFELTSRR